MKKKTIIYASPDLLEMRINLHCTILTGSIMGSAEEYTSSDGEWSQMDDGGTEGFGSSEGQW